MASNNVKEGKGSNEGRVWAREEVGCVSIGKGTRFFFSFSFFKITKASVTLDNQTVVTQATHTFAETLKEPEDKNNLNLIQIS